MFDVITIGSATVDLFLRSRFFSIIKSGRFISGEGECLPAGAKIEVKEITFATGGGATNSAVSFARKSLRAACIASLGRDYMGRDVIQDLAKEGVYTGYVQEKKDKRTAFSVVLVAKDGSRTVLVHRGASEDIDIGEIPWEDLKTHWLYISSLAGDLSLMKSLIHFARVYGVKVAWNPGSRELSRGLKILKGFMSDVEVFLLNQEEASELSGIDFEKTELIFQKLDRYVKGLIVMTQGEKGVMVSDGKTLYKAGIFPEKKKVDRTGCGDAFGSGFVAALIHEKPVEQAVKIASANSTSVLEHTGAKRGLLSTKQLKAKRWEEFKVLKKKIKP